MRIVPTEEQLEYLDNVIKRMDVKFANDFKGSDHKTGKFYGKLAEIVLADLLGWSRPHWREWQPIKPDKGYDVQNPELTIKVDSKSSSSGDANVNVSCMIEKGCDYFVFFQHHKEDGTLTLLGGASWEDVKASPVVNGKYSKMHKVENLGALALQLK